MPKWVHMSFQKLEIHLLSLSLNTWLNKPYFAITRYRVRIIWAASAELKLVVVGIEIPYLVSLSTIFADWQFHDKIHSNNFKRPCWGLLAASIILQAHVFWVWPSGIYHRTGWSFAHPLTFWANSKSWVLWYPSCAPVDSWSCVSDRIFSTDSLPMQSLWFPCQSSKYMRFLSDFVNRGWSDCCLLISLSFSSVSVLYTFSKYESFW